MPLESVSRAFKDISLSFKRNPVTNDTIALRNEDAIKKAVVNLVRTKVGEWFFTPLIGSRVEDYLFELADDTVEEPLKIEIRDVISNFEPRVVLRNVTIDVDTQDNAIYASISYDIVGLEFSLQEVSFVLQPTRY